MFYFQSISSKPFQLSHIKKTKKNALFKGAMVPSPLKEKTIIKDFFQADIPHQSTHVLTFEACAMPWRSKGGGGGGGGGFYGGGNLHTNSKEQEGFVMN